MKYIKNFYANLFTFNGRQSRKDYWMTALILYIVSVALSLIFLMFLHAKGISDTTRMIIALAISVVTLVISIGGLTISVRRLHDTNRSGFSLLYALIPIIGTLIVLYYHCMPGDVHANDYGEPVALD